MMLSRMNLGNQVRLSMPKKIPVPGIRFLWQKPEGVDTGIKIFNCIEDKKVPLILPKGNVATWYTCGPTVYDASHIGHASCYVKIDIIQRILRRHFQINLITAMNITDIDDKIIKRALETKFPWETIAKDYENDFWEDMLSLGLDEPDIKLRVTDNISVIIKFIENIVGTKKGYIAKDGSVYFDVKSYSSYGKLQKVVVEETKDENKNINADFALWKRKKENEPFWDSPWGPGRPGWHIECSALASKIFGSVLDFHAGGLDLRFPHHENEETQSCAFHNTNQWVNYWLHTGQLHVAGQDDKMSKSLKNTISIKEMLSKYTKNDFRMACLMSNYRNSMQYSDEMMLTARNTFNKFEFFNSDCQAFTDGLKVYKEVNEENIFHKINQTKTLLDMELKNDFNTGKCVTHLLDLMKTVSLELNNKNDSNKEGISYSSSGIPSVLAARNLVNCFMETVGFSGTTTRISHSKQVKIDNIITDVVFTRKILRDLALSTKNKDLFRICDNIREKLHSNGVELTDHQTDTSWKFIK